jgi:fatty acid desaturase
MTSFIRYEDSLWPNLMALSYALSGYFIGLGCILSASVWLNFVGVLLLAHSMVIAAYLVHECAHNTILKKNSSNARLGRFLNWLTGACYGDYEDIRHKHFRHHADRADVVAFDYRQRLAQHPLLTKLVQIAEWLYIPAVEVLMHLLVIVLPFVMPTRQHRRRRVLIVLAIRVSLFSLLMWYSPRVALLYPLAYMLFLTVMRFMDVHQHTYEIFETLEKKRGAEAKRFDRNYEQRNTYSNLFSTRHPWLNLLTLNFGYHNAHHLKPNAPWYQLPALHQALYGNDDSQLLPFSNLLRAYHRYRVPRTLNADNGDIGQAEARGSSFIGVDGVSFLTAH